jgi:hypothetical protein
LIHRSMSIRRQLFLIDLCRFHPRQPCELP